MKKNTYYKTLALLSILTFLLGACGSSTQTPDPVIATAVALTVAAQNVQQNAPTSTAIPTATVPANITFPTPTQLQFPTPTKSGSSTNTACAKANFVSETIPDGTIMKPGDVFTKTWQIKNDSSCTWDATYKIVYWGGNSVMGGAYYYNLPQAIAPGGVIDISLVLTAPTEEGEFTSEWMLQTPNNIAFGVGQYNEPFSAKIVVSKADKPVTGITDVKLEVIRDPAAGCWTNVWYRYVAQVSANGKIKIRYGFQQSDHTIQWRGDLEFTEAGTKTVTGEWSFHLGSSPGQKWVQFVVIKPYYQEFEKQYFSYLCSNTP